MGRTWGAWARTNLGGEGCGAGQLEEGHVMPGGGTEGGPGDPRVDMDPPYREAGALVLVTGGGPPIVSLLPVMEAHHHLGYPGRPPHLKPRHDHAVGRREHVGPGLGGGGGPGEEAAPAHVLPAQHPHQGHLAR